MIQISDLNKTYSMRNGSVKAIDKINLTLDDTGMVFVLGKSGSGKTTLLNLMAGIDDADSGSIKANFLQEDNTSQEDILKLTEEQLDEYHNIYMGVVFQNYYLINEWSVEDNVKIILQQQDNGLDESSHQEEVSQMLEYVGLSGLENRKIYELSGGQAQRVAIARALIKKPKVIFADEPTGNLDAASGKSIWQLLKEISKERLVVVVSHDENAATEYGDRIIRIKDGRIIDDKILATSNLAYKITMVNNESKEVYSHIAKRREEISDYICKILFKKSENKFLVDIESVEVEGQKIESSCESRNVRVKELPLKMILRLAINNLNKRKFRISAIIIILTMMLSFLQFVAGIGVADVGRPIAKYLTDNKIEKIYLQTTLTYENSFLEKEYITRGDTPKLVQSIRDSWRPENIEACCANIGISAKYEESTVLLTTDTESTVLLYGKLPEKQNEICITDFLAYMLGLTENCVNESILLHNVEFKICGVVKTDYESAGLLDRIYNRKTTQMDEHNMRYMYRKVYCANGFESYIKENVPSVDIYASDFTVDSEQYLYLSRTYAGVSLLNDSYILYGKYPEAANEVLVSYDFAVNHDLLIDNEFVGEKTFSYKNIYDTKYNGAYEGYINMHDILGDVKVVGAVLDMSDSLDVDVWIDDAVYQKIKETYFNDIIFDLYEIDTKGTSFDALRKNVNNLYENGVFIDEPMILEISQIYEMKQEVVNMLVIFALVFALVVILLDVSYISCSINDNGYKIGILRALGVSKSAIIKLFVYESVIVSILSFVFSYLVSALLFGVLNHYFSSQNGVEIVYFIQNEWVSVCTFLFIFAMGIIDVVFPIMTMIKEQPIKLIKS